MRLRNFLILLLFSPFFAFAQNAADSENLDARLLKLSSELRCLVCQNQSIADSDADLATDLKNEIRTMLSNGQTDAQILDFMVARYGDFVRYNPPVQTNTLILWGAPVLFFAVGVLCFLLYLKNRNRRLKNAAPDSAELQRAAALLESRDD